MKKKTEYFFTKIFEFSKIKLILFDVFNIIKNIINAEIEKKIIFYNYQNIF